MSFYFQPPVFAVQPTACVQAVVWAPAPAAVPAYCAVVQPMPAPAVVYTTTTPVIQVYTAPMVSAAAALPDGQRPGLRIRIIFYGHGPGREAPRSLWCRAADATYPGAPTGSRLRDDIARLAEVQNLAQQGWRRARIVVAAPGSAAPVIAAELGPVLGDDVVRVLELQRDAGADEDAAEAERNRVLQTSLAGGQAVFLTVCMDDEAGAGPSAPSSSGGGHVPLLSADV
ncbi:hypothetical protein MAC_01851 [Metarhizium acridum CQMa 102]|uniref:Uncharacterized protein n=1 Tax=Metarhizium acridum (strain CQMa 102) TaxID=655827 RepID=E9DW53_METAQ|nr:uncharacterized protein MAC_01851 [Metarhizium acridum CQMa 102]EFY92250.1 hypothetical protein MAC_01851 [Metarhizium acridum CQMa 102]